MRQELTAVAIAIALAGSPAEATFAARQNRPVASAFTNTLHTVFLTTASSSPWTVDPTWQSATNGTLGFANRIECVGAGGGGAEGTSPKAGGAGGDYAKISNLSISGTAAFHIGAGGAQNGGAGGDSYFNGASIAASSVGAKGGGSASSDVGASFAGGSSTASSVRAGGGGAAGLNGAGGSVVNATPGGVGDNSSGGASGSGNGTEWDASHGSGGGGNGGAAGGSGGSFGAGGGAAAASSSGTGGDGLCVIRWYSMLTLSPSPFGHAWRASAYS